jgi:hypothetical protein
MWAALHEITYFELEGKDCHWFLYDISSSVIEISVKKFERNPKTIN